MVPVAYAGGRRAVDAERRNVAAVSLAAFERAEREQIVFEGPGEFVWMQRGRDGTGRKAIAAADEMQLLVLVMMMQSRVAGRFRSTQLQIC